MGRRTTPQWKPNSRHKPHKPSSSGDKFQAPTADLFSFGFSRCCSQFGHQGVLRSGVVTLLFLSLGWPLPPSAQRLGPTTHFGKSYNRAAANASIFQEIQQTNYFLQGKLRSLSPPPAPKGRVSIVTLCCYTASLSTYTAQGHSSLCDLGI